MKRQILAVGLMVWSSAGVAGDIKPAADRESVRGQYDELVKASGKWDFISSASTWMACFSGATALYAYDRSLYYRDLSKDRELTGHEKSEFEHWDNLANHSGYAAGAFIGLAIYGAAVEVHYESRAHAFALDMGVKF